MNALSLKGGILPGLHSFALPVAILVLVGMMVVPVPTFLLDAFFIMNIIISLAVLMVALNAQKPLDFSAFPTVLLFATLFRLGLNVASTRVVLGHGHEGEAAAGHVIEAFGTFMIGGDYIVGLFVFAILIIINMIVVTKGAGRVSEVSARFTLDALPGKQMAIDADLNAGLITPDEAKARRIEVSTEADFYGAMDGSSKFVKGDAVAGLLILFINIIGGLILGPVSHGLTLGEARARIERQLAADRHALDGAARALVEAGLVVWSEDDARRPVLIVRGQGRLIDAAAAADLERLRDLLDDLEGKQEIAQLLDSARAGDATRIFIGAENKLFALSGSSVIARPFRGPGGRVVGVVGVIGPTRLNYARVVPMVDFTAATLARLMG